MFKILKNSKRVIWSILLTTLVISMITVFLDQLPKNPVHKNPPTDYFRVVYNLPYVEAEKYNIISYEEELFEYFSVLKFFNQSDIDQFVYELRMDELTVEHEIINGVAPALNLFEEGAINELSKVELLPFNLKCGCFRYFTYNLEMKNAGYLYLILIYEDLIIIDYMTR